MLKWLLIAALSMFVFLFSCTENPLQQNKTSVVFQQTKKNLSDPSLPIVFAKFKINAEIDQITSNNFNVCQGSLLYKIKDFCAPSPKLARQDQNVSNEKLTTWQLPKTPQHFYWQQELSVKEILTVELIDNDGLPWPCSSFILQKENQFLVYIRIDYELPKNREMLLMGSVYDEEGKKQKTWILPLYVLEGSEQSQIWKSTPKVVSTKKSKKKRKK